MAIALKQFVKHLEDSGILADDTLKDFIPPNGSPKNAEDLASELVRQKKLTNFQAEEVSKGNGKSLVLGNYVLIEKIGEGGMGEVYKAEHRRMKRFVAIKLLPPAMTNDKAAIARFEREVTAAAKISHPNIVAAHDADCANGVHFLVMELVEGSDLSALVKKNGPFSIDKTVSYVLQAATGLEAAHKKGIVHRDIKPANLLLDSEGTVKILDMGLARLGGVGDDSSQADLTTTGMIMGTVDYMAPEQAMDTKTADARADIYSLGCTLYYLLTSRATYEGDTIMKKLMAHRQQPSPSLRAARPEVTEQLEFVFKKMIAKNLEDRYQTMSELIADLERLDLSQASSAYNQHLDDKFQQPTNSTPSADPFGTMVGQASDPHATMVSPSTDPYASKVSQSSVARLQPVTASGWGNKTFIFRSLGAAFFGLFLLAGIIVSLDTKDGKLIVEVDQKDAMVQVLDEEGKVEVSQKGGGKITISVDPGKHRLKVVKDGFTTFGQEFEMEKNGKKEITARLEPLGSAVVGAMPAPVAGEKRPLAFQTPGFNEWVQQVQAMPAEQQVETVSKKLMELNPGFDGQQMMNPEWHLPHTIEEGVVIGFSFISDNVTDISPVLALKGLKWLGCWGSAAGKGKLYNLLPLKGMMLTRLDCRNNEIADLLPLKGIPLTYLLCMSTKIADLSPLNGMMLDYLGCSNTKIVDLSPLKGMPLKDLNIHATNVSDLSPLKGMKLNFLSCSWSLKIADLSPLHGMPLTFLCVDFTSVADLTPLKGMPLTHLRISNTPVTDLSPLKDMKLQSLEMTSMQIADLSILKNMPLKELFLDFKLERDTELASSLKTLEMINHKPAAEFWKALESPAPQKQTLAFQTPGFDEWVQQVQAMPAEQQVEIVRKKLVELNPGFDGQQMMNPEWNLKPTIEEGVVMGFSFISDNVTDISPVRALKGLKWLGCWGSAAGKGKLYDLLPLTGMMLTGLDCRNNEIADLSPLKGIPLTHLFCFSTKIADLSPLKGMLLDQLLCSDTRIVDLSPLKGMPLKDFNMQYTNVSDLSPLKGMKLNYLACSAAIKLADLSPLHGMPLTHFDVESTKVADLSPLKGMPLTSLRIGGTAVTDLSPLKDMKLQDLEMALTQIADLSSLKDMPLTRLRIGSQVSDLSLLKNMPLKVLFLDFKPDLDTALLLRSLKTLETINDKPAAEFWKEVEG